MTPINTERIKDSLKSLIGKKFLYRAKSNDMIFGTISDVGITHMLSFDERTESSISRFLDKGGLDESRRETLTTSPGPNWAGIKIDPFIIDDGGVSYSLTEIYILSKYEP